MIAFYNMIDIVAINALTLWLCQNPSWNNQKQYIRRIFLEQLSKTLTNSHNERQSKQYCLTTNLKLALQCLGFELKPQTQVGIVNDKFSKFNN